MAHEFAFGGEIAWRPTAEHSATAGSHSSWPATDVTTYDALLRRSTEDLNWFWDAVLDDLGIEFYEPYRQLARHVTRHRVDALVRRRHTQHRPQLPRQVDGHADRAQGGAALGGRRRSDARRHVRRAPRRRESLRQCPAASSASGKATGSGSSCRCVPSWSSRSLRPSRWAASVLPLFSGYGADAGGDHGCTMPRPRVLVTADGFWRRGQLVAMKATADERRPSPPSIRHVIVVPARRRRALDRRTRLALERPRRPADRIASKP